MTKLNVLIADDEELLCELYQMIIESEFSCDITKVYDGESAINLIKNNTHFDLIISDFNMPKATGGALFLANKAHRNIPFLLFSGGEISDYKDFKDFKNINPLNHFFNKPFDDSSLINVIQEIAKFKSVDETSSDEKFIKIKLAYYILYTKKTAEVYIKLSDSKYTKILNKNDENVPDSNLLDHYRNKGIEYIYLEETSYQNFLSDVFKKFNDCILSEKKLDTLFRIAGIDLKISVEGLNSIGISNYQIESTNKEIHESIVAICSNPESKHLFEKVCQSKGMLIGHSALIIYIAAAICKVTNLPFSSTVRKISTASFFHDMSMFNADAQFDENNIEQITDKNILKLIAEHPITSASLLSPSSDLAEDTKKIILEHHELPNGNGYPKGLNASQISQLSCLFIMAQLIALCLIRNNFSLDRLNDFLANSEHEYNQGNFSKFYKAAKSIFFSQAINDTAI